MRDTIELLQRAEEFIAGFEDDISQNGVRDLLADLRALTGPRPPHTAGEWKVSDSDPCTILDDYNGGRGPWRFIACTRDADDGALPAAEAEANARRIVQCVNAHDELFAIALALLAEGADIEAIVERARAATGSPA